MSKLSIIVPVYWNSDTLMLLYEDMKEKILHIWRITRLSSWTTDPAIIPGKS